MIRVVIGAVAAAAAMFVIGFVFFGLLQGIPVGNLDDQQAATVQNVLAANMDPESARTVIVPSPNDGAVQQSMYIDGPVAMIHYNPDGFAVSGSSALLGGFIHMLVSALILGGALYSLSGHVRDFGARLSIVALFGISASFFMHLGNPIWWHQDWLYHGYVFFADAVMFIVGGAIIARWFLPRHIDSDDRFGEE